ncbi:hypothetical protein ACMU_00540 [Actibacterium mucosum KCTC 23349]|uniref:YCII-related domain-containing protein n=1 Tax=Actibacterium mucosum KCTC 23349 TaxID=1454373 RepID=A0A037ZQA1_9RHOB|nr:YciI family protein [Actibacterium mucosum]KAJ57012.1 hypothetical protein ACMU_00540 [Actibacterium mucosum KCTC 23349]
MYFSILIYGEDGAWEQLPPEEQQKVMEGHKALQKALGERGPFATAKLMGASAAVTLQPVTEGADALVLDGPFADTKERFLGFYGAEFEDLDEAIRFARFLSSAYARIEVRPVEWAGGVLAQEA